MINKLIILSCMLSFAWSCKKIENYSEVPAITFIDVKTRSGIDVLGNEEKIAEIIFHIKDGDGDIGLSESDTAFPFKGDSAFNFFPTLLIKNGSKYIISDSLGVVQSNVRMPHVGDLGERPVLNADVYVSLSYPSKLMRYDTVQYRFFIIDRSFNKSNEIVTGDVVFH